MKSENHLNFNYTRDISNNLRYLSYLLLDVSALL
jgi:hypothetical protein